MDLLGFTNGQNRVTLKEAFGLEFIGVDLETVGRKEAQWQLQVLTVIE